MSKISSEALLELFTKGTLILKDSLDYRKILNQNEYISLDFDNKSRLDIINLAITKNKAKKYLEIGCDYNETFDFVKVESKVGVDPNRGGNVRLSSDMFFSNNHEYFDVIFIDGCHTYQQIRKDILNSLKCLNQNGIIIIHDMLPIAEKQVLPYHPDIWYPGWLGSAYKIAFELSEINDFIFKIVKADMGCGIIMKYNHKDVLIPNLDVDWKFFVDNYQKLPLISYSEYKEIL